MSYFIYGVSIVLGSLGAWFVSSHAHILGLIDQPNHRSSHDRPTPKGGGIGILAAFILACLLYGVSILFWLPVTFLSLLSLYGDRINLNPSFRLVVQFCVAFLFLYSITFITLNKNWLLPITLYIFFAVYIVGTGNFFNFMDGINGIAGITGIIGFGLLGTYGLVTDQSPQWVTLALVMGFACAGFLPFNLPNAKVFMGDVGSVLLGFVFACIAVAFARTFSDFIILASFMFPFYIDELVTMVERIMDKQRLTLPHRRHFYQVLANEAKIDHWKVSVGYGIAQILIGVIVWFAILQNLVLGLSVIFFFMVSFFFINMKVKKELGCWIGSADQTSHKASTRQV